MKKITSIALLTTAEGKRISFTYSEINENGDIIAENKRVNKVIVDKNILDLVNDLEEYAQEMLE